MQPFRFLLYKISFQVQFPETLFVTGIDIYETYYGGAVTTVLARISGGTWQILWGPEEPQAIEHARIFSPKLQVETYSNFMTNLFHFNRNLFQISIFFIFVLLFYVKYKMLRQGRTFPTSPELLHGTL